VVAQVHRLPASHAAVHTQRPGIEVSMPLGGQVPAQLAGADRGSGAAAEHASRARGSLPRRERACVENAQNQRQRTYTSGAMNRIAVVDG